MEIRHSELGELPRIMEIYEHARSFMAEHGNPNQWGPAAWPPEALIREDIEAGYSYVCVHEGRIIASFYYRQGEDIEPCYREIENGSWSAGGAYGVVHRIASDGTVPGTGGFCLDWAFRRCGHLRIDTHEDNRVMQRLLRKQGFEYRGIIHVEEDEYPRLAYEKLQTNGQTEGGIEASEAGVIKKD